VIPWETVEDAIHAWVTAGSGLDASKVIWSQQGGERPKAPYISLRIRSIRQIGQDWLKIQDATAPVTAGSEIKHLAQGQREVGLSLQCFASTAQSGMAAASLLESARASARLPTIHQALSDAGVGILQSEPVQSIDGFLGDSQFEPRAVLELRLMLASEVSEFSTYIETVEIENEITDTEFTVTL
jgi:hypothetical protein